MIRGALNSQLEPIQKNKTKFKNKNDFDVFRMKCFSTNIIIIIINITFIIIIIAYYYHYYELLLLLTQDLKFVYVISSRNHTRDKHQKRECCRL